jgi:hypothetical protein
MAKIYTAEIELIGPHAGKDMVISGQQFTKGFATLVDGDENRLNAATRLFEYSGGFVVGSEGWKARKELFSGLHDSESGETGAGSLSGNSDGGDDKSSATKQPNGEGHDLNGGASAVPAGTTGSGAPSRYDPSQIKKLAEAVTKLNPEVDEHWTDGGLPRLKALEAAGFPGVARDMVEAAAPGWTREKALAEVV